jgi:low molecular weight protein-tyrosine phosphatase
MVSPSAGPRPLRVLFVCTGNICRSPLAEAVFKGLVSERGLARRYEADSAGTYGYHEGDPADPRTVKVGLNHGLAVDSIARELRDADFTRFDLLVAMDRGHLREMRARCAKPLQGKLVMMSDYGPEGVLKDVPDPYYGPLSGFEDIYQILDRCCRGLLDALLSQALEAASPASSVPRV